MTGRPAILALGLLAGLAQAAPRDYVIDPVHTRIVFAVDHLQLSSSIGTLSAPTGRLRFDPQDWRTAAVDVEIPLARLDMGDADWNTRMLRRDFFDADAHPIARFRSTRIEPIDARHALVHGDLTLRGVTRPLTLDVRFNRATRHPLTLRAGVGFSAVAALDRSDFGMTAWRTMVGDRIDLRIEVEAMRARRGDPRLPGAAAADDPEDEHSDNHDRPSREDHDDADQE